jgi:predicted ATPase
MTRSRRRQGVPPTNESRAPYLLEVQLRRERVPSFDEYPFAVPVIRSLHTLALHPAVTFLVGENGSGKSTLLEAIAVAAGFNAEGGSRNFRFSTRASHSSLHECLRVVRGTHRETDGFFLRAESLYNTATVIDEVDRLATRPPPRSLHEQSHGESFMALMTERFRGNGLYLMDEPEAALSPTRQMTMVSLIHQFVTSGAQLVIATHSPILMAYPNAQILECSDAGMRRVAYEDTEHYTVTRDFLNRYPAMLKVLLEDEGAGQDD